MQVDVCCLCVYLRVFVFLVSHLLLAIDENAEQPECFQGLIFYSQAISKAIVAP